MKYNYKKIRDEVAAKVKRACYSPDNYCTETVWPFHILPVAEHCLKLGKKLKADLEVLELAALLHDLAAVTDKKYAEDHHIHGAKMAEKILSELGMPEEKIINIKNCVLNHRGSKPGRRESLEEKILASADAMSHITELADMMYLTYGVHKFKTEPGAAWLKSKLERGWKKIMPQGRQMIRKDYKTAMIILDQVINRL